MEYTKEMRLANEQAAHEHCRKVQSIRFAIASNRTWDSDHPEQIKKQIARLQSLLKEATQ